MVAPDGSRIAFTTGRDGATEIYVVNSDGSGLTRVTNHPGDDFTPTWSPDGSRIAFASDRDGDAEIFVARPDGSGLTQLTHNEADDTNPDWASNEVEPRPSPAATEAPLQEQVCPISVRYELAESSRDPTDVRLVI